MWATISRTRSMQKSSWTTRLALQRRHSSIKFVAVSDAQGTAINGATHYIVPVVKQAPSPAYPDSHAHAFRQLTMRFTSSIPDADDVPILGSDEQTATITEAAAAPASPPAAAPLQKRRSASIQTSMKLSRLRMTKPDTNWTNQSSWAKTRPRRLMQ